MRLSHKIIYFSLTLLTLANALPAAAINVIPPELMQCAADGALTQKCRDVSIFIVLIINLGSYIFTIIGALALAVFVYGGFMFILSAGNPEKIKKGIDAMLAAVIGLVIAFGGYFLIRFLGEAIQVKPEFRLK